MPSADVCPFGCSACCVVVVEPLVVVVEPELVVEPLVVVVEPELVV